MMQHIFQVEILEEICVITNKFEIILKKEKKIAVI